MKKNKAGFLSIIAPIKNEEKNIAWTVHAIEDTVKIKHEIIVVYDSDQDKTLPIVKRLQKKNRKVRLLRNNLGSGVLNAVRSGIANSNGDMIVMMAVDRTDDPSTINVMVEKIKEGYDVVCPTRYSKGGRVKGRVSVKSLLSRFSGISTPLFLGIPTSDLTYSYKMFRKEVIRRIEIKSSGGFEFAEELVIKAHFGGFKITEVPTLWNDRVYGKSKFKLISWLPRYIYWYLWGFIHRLKQSLVLLSLFLFFVLLAIFAISFRSIRDFLPPPMINQEKVVGHAQYFGYPFYLDTAIFIFFVIYPPISIIFLKKVLRTNPAR